MGVPETVEFSLGESEDEDDEEPAELAQDSKGNSFPVSRDIHYGV